MSRHGLVLVCIGLAGCSDAVFNCADDTMCEGGFCEVTGFCSFPDQTCASGRRYAEHSGTVSGLCVPDDATTSGTSIGSSSDESSTGGMPLDPDLVAWYRFEGDLEDGVIDDATDNQLDGTCVVSECPVSAPGAVGNAASSTV